MSSGGKRIGAGRKPSKEPNRLNKTIRFTPQEWQTIKQLAKLNNQTASEYVRFVCLNAEIAIKAKERRREEGEMNE